MPFPIRPPAGTPPSRRLPLQKILLPAFALSSFRPPVGRVPAPTRQARLPSSRLARLTSARGGSGHHSSLPRLDHMPFRPRSILLALILAGTAVCASATPVAAPAAIAPEKETPVTPVPAPAAWLDDLEALYDSDLRVDGLEQRTFSPEHWWQRVMPLIDGADGFLIEEMGRSAEGRPLRHVAWGEGTTSVLLWSQMHGDESTATMALADLLHFLGAHPDHPLVARLRENTALHFFPLVNPDGAARFQRRNAQGVDINRDARALATPEGRTLKALRDRIEPHFGFNLHDQRPGYRAGDSDRGVAIALLAPPFDEARGINPVRRRAMEVAAVKIGRAHV